MIQYKTLMDFTRILVIRTVSQLRIVLFCVISVEGAGRNSMRNKKVVYRQNKEMGEGFQRLICFIRFQPADVISEAKNTQQHSHFILYQMDTTF